MASAIFRIGRLKGIERPAIGALFPTRDQTRPVLVLDVGANTDCKPSYLHQFALLGNVYAKDVLLIEKPRIGLLNIGEEECKGNDLSLKTFELLSNEKNFNFSGIVKEEMFYLVILMSSFAMVLQEIYYLNFLSQLEAFY